MKEVRSIAELESLSGWHPDNVVIKANYRRLEARTTLPEEIPCRLVKDSGTVCGEGHRFGWVVESHDGSLAAVGGTCALTHFGAESTMARDVTVATNALDLQRDLARAEALLQERDAKLASITAALAEILALKDRLARIRDNLGRVAWRALEDMGRNSRGQVQITGVRRALYDQDGEKTRDRLEVSITVGTLRAVTLAKPSTLESVATSLRTIATTFRRANLDLLRSKRSKDVKLLTSALSQHGRALLDAQEVLRLGEQFEANDFTLLCYAVKDRAERYKVAKAAMRRADQMVSSDAAKAWVIARDSQLKQEHRVDRLDIE